MDDHARREQGMQARREVLGEGLADRSVGTTTEFNSEFREMMTRHAWGEVWIRPGLDRRTRSAALLGALAATNHPAELAIHVKAAINNGLTPDEIKEIFMQLGVYFGAAVGNEAFNVGERALNELRETGEL